MVRKQAQQKMKHDQHSKLRKFQIGQSVLTRNYRPGPLWLPGIIEERTGPLSYVVKLGSGLRWKRHVDQLLSSNSNSSPTSDPIGYPPVPVSSTPLSDQVPVEETKKPLQMIKNTEVRVQQTLEWHYQKHLLHHPLHHLLSQVSSNLMLDLNP